MTRWNDRLTNGWPRLAVVAHDMAMVWAAWVGLHQLRFALAPTMPPFPLWSPEIFLVLVAQGLVFWRVGLYRGVWRFSSVPDLINILRAGAFGLLAIVVGLFLYNRLDLVPRSVLVLYPLVLTAMLGMPLLLYRSWKDFQSARNAKAGLRVLILGAGSAGEALVRDLRR